MDRKLFLVVIKELNQDKELLAKVDEKKIIVVGKKTDVLIQDFKRVMIKLDDAGLTDDVSENCIDFFEENLAEFMPKKDSEESKKIEEVVENPEKEIEEGSVEKVEENKDGKVSEEKSEEVSAEVEASSEEVVVVEQIEQRLSVYGHREGTQAAKIDTLFEAGTTIENAAKVVGVKQSRIKSHLYHLQKKKNLAIEVDNNGVYKVKG